MYLNKTGIIGQEPESATETIEAEALTESSAGDEFPADIQSIIEDSQGNYAEAMLVFEEVSSPLSLQEKPQKES